MNRRQYKPGSGRHGAATVSRRQLAQVNKKLVAQRDTALEIANAQRDARIREKEERERHSLRGFLERTRKFFNRPIRLSKRSA